MAKSGRSRSVAVAWGLLAVASAFVAASCGGKALVIDGDDGGTDASTTTSRDGGFPPIGVDGALPNPNPNPSPPPPKPPPPPPPCAGGGDICVPTCAPYTKKWLPPHPHLNACSQADIDLFRKICLGSQSDGGAACKSFTATAAGKVCTDCILPSTGTALGPLIVSGGFVSPNISGCIAIAQGTIQDGAGCASASLYLNECRAAACGACAKDPNTTTDRINACDTTADNSVCASESAAAKCLDSLTGTPAAACLAGTDFDTTYAAIVPTFCLTK